MPRSSLASLLSAGSLAGAVALALLALTAFPRRSRADVPPSSATPPPLPPLAGEWLEAVGTGFVSPPTGATEPRPVVVAVHGAGDRADWACSEWRAVFGPRPFIVCPRGSPRPFGFAWGSTSELRAAIAGLVGQAQAKYGAHFDAGHRVYAGFSQGAILGARIVKDEAATYPYVVFQEGLGEVGATAFTASFRRGGARILLGCSQGGCRHERDALRATLSFAGIDARVNDSGPQGHTINGVVIASLRKDVPWLLAGDPAWRAVIADMPEADAGDAPSGR